ncbi:uncharacterized protein PG986_000933 [Apiospora aurea]|uniref:Cell wall protein SED1 n=1 Tax=Apiospora aurea TaxID=335848 RepID=A0ABR1QVD3_9PEZI
MKTMQIAPMAGLLAAANAWGTTGGAEGTAYTTLVTTDYVTYCPEPTTFAYKNVTYTVTSPTTLTITNCPCTISVSQPPPVTTTSYCPPTSYPIGTGKPPVPTYGNSSIAPRFLLPRPPWFLLPPPPASTGYYTTITSTPPPVTYLPGTSGIPGKPTAPGAPGVPGAPTNTPIAPTTTGSVPIPTAGAAKAGTVGALIAVAGLAIAL